MSLTDIFGGGDKKTTTEPWKAQQPHLRGVFSGAQNLYNQGPNQYYQGNTVAGSNNAIDTYLSGMGGQAQSGMDVGQQMGQYGEQLAGGLTGAQNFYSDGMSAYTNPYASVDYQNKFNNLENPYGSQQYNSIISDSVNNNPMLDQQIQQGQQDISRNMQENIMPGIAGSAVGTGNASSTRRGVAEGVAMRGAMEQGSDMATNMRSNAYNQGINQANNYAQGQQFNQNAGMQGANNMASGTQFGQNYQMQSANNAGSMGRFGLGQMGAGYNQGTQAYQDLLSSGVYGRGMDQENINADRERFDFEQNAPWDNLNRYNQMIQGNYGGTTTQEGNGLGNQLLQMGMQAGSAYLTGGGSLAMGGGGGGTPAKAFNPNEWL